MSEVVSKCGIHCMGDRRDGYGPFLERIYSSGRRLSVVKVRDNLGAVDEPLALWPDVLCVGAFTEFDRLPFDFNRFKTRAMLNDPRIKIWEVLNEDDASQTYSAKADLYINLAYQFDQLGWSLCMFNCASGTPPYPEEDGGVAYRHIARACRYMIDNGYTAYLGLHEYISDGGTMYRYKRLADYLASQGALLPIIITEWLFETHPGDDAFMSAVKAHDPDYMADPRVLGCATWTLGGGSWAGSNYQTALPRLGEYIATVAPVPPIEPPPTNDEWEFDYWELNGQRVDGNPIEIVMGDNYTLTPHAKKKSPPPATEYTLTVNACPEWAGLTVRVVPPYMIYPAGTRVVCEAIA